MHNVNEIVTFATFALKTVCNGILYLCNSETTAVKGQMMIMTAGDDDD